MRVLNASSSHAAHSRTPQQTRRGFASDSRSPRICCKAQLQTDGARASAPAADAAKAASPKPQLLTKLVQEPAGVKRRGLMLAGAAAMFGCACCQDMLAAQPARADEWTYNGPKGPRTWGGSCGIGLKQSPVNVPLTPDEASAYPTGKFKFPVGPLGFKYGRYEKVSVFNTGHGTMQVNFLVGNTVNVPRRYLPTVLDENGLPVDEVEAADRAAEGGDGKPPCLCPTKPFEMELLQYHFHTPSEHALNGKQFAMEAHLVHRNKETGGLAVVAVMLQQGGVTPNPCLQLGLDFAPREKGVLKPAPKSVNPSMLLPAKANGEQPYVHYAGSLTTPPCSESVDWFVMTKPIKVTDRQVIQFMEFAGDGLTYGRNARPLQDLNGRLFEFEV